MTPGDLRGGDEPVKEVGKILSNYGLYKGKKNSERRCGQYEATMEDKG